MAAGWRAAGWLLAAGSGWPLMTAGLLGWMDERLLDDMHTYMRSINNIHFFLFILFRATSECQLVCLLVSNACIGMPTLLRSPQIT